MRERKDKSLRILARFRVTRKRYTHIGMLGRFGITYDIAKRPEGCSVVGTWSFLEDFCVCTKLQWENKSYNRLWYYANLAPIW